MMNQILPIPKAISLTDAAATRIKDIMSRPPPANDGNDGNDGTAYIGLRLGLKNAGCAGMEYTMEYATQARTHDEVVEEKGVTVLIDPKAILFLLGTEMDYEVSSLSSGFVFNNPNQTDACGCGESVTLVAQTSAATQTSKN